MAVPTFGVDDRTMTGSIAQLESLFVVTATKRAISSLSVSARDLIRERYMQWNKKMRRTYTSSVRSAVIRTIGLHRVNSHTTCFKLYMGAAVTVLSDDVQWLKDVELTKTSQVLRGPGNTQLPLKGLFYATLKYRQSKLTEPIYVVHNQKCSLLSMRACV